MPPFLSRTEYYFIAYDNVFKLHGGACVVQILGLYTTCSNLLCKLCMHIIKSFYKSLIFNKAFILSSWSAFTVLNLFRVVSRTNYGTEFIPVKNYCTVKLFQLNLVFPHGLLGTGCYAVYAVDDKQAWISGRHGTQCRLPKGSAQWSTSAGYTFPRLTHS